MSYKWKDKKEEYQKEYHAEWYKKNREQVKVRSAQRRQELKEWWREYKSTLKCKKCGECHPATLDFHHVDMEDKEDGLSKILQQGLSKKRVMEEIKKYEVLCANCHRKLHYHKGYQKMKC